MIQIRIPESEAKLYDLLQQSFGIGDYDEAAGTQAWWQARNVEIGKLRRVMKSRRVNVDDLTIATWHALVEQEPITATWQLCALVPQARRAYRKARTETPDLRRQLDMAAADAHMAGWEGWASRLFNADLASARLVLNEYEQHKVRAR